jgi:anaerobic magnesium-protoporphyrin IX monomethyl ester cyclase
MLWRNRKRLSVSFIHTPCPELDEDRLEPPLGILYMATMLSREGYECHICDLSGVDEADWKSKIVPADVFAFSTYSVNFHLTRIILRLAKELNPSAITVAGGPHVSAEPIDSKKFFDVVVVGEGEVRMMEIMHSLSRGEKFHHSIYVGHPLQDLDLLPFPDYDLADIDSYTRRVEGKKSISMVTSRGCPFNCAFCNSRIFSRGELRLRSPQNVVEEIVRLKSKYGTGYFRFGDDLFTFSPARTIEMCRAIAPLDIKYRIFARSGSLTPEACKALAESGCRHVAVGIESMSDEMLVKMHKRATADQNRRGLANAKAAGLTVRVYLLVGFPGETDQTFEKGLEGIKGCDFDEFVVYPFIPYPGTGVWSHPFLWNCDINRDISKYVQVGKGRKTCFAVTMLDGSFTPEKVEFWRARMIKELEAKTQWAGFSLPTK